MAGTFMGLAVPLYGDSNIINQTAANDVLTLTGASAQTGDFFVAETSAGTEVFVVEDGGNVVITQAAAADIGLKIVQASTPTVDVMAVYANDGTTQRFGITKNHGLRLRIRTTKPTTGLTKGELFLLMHNTNPKIGVCSSTATQKIKMIRLKTTTLGRLTA